MARLFNPKWKAEPDEAAAVGCCEEIDKFLQAIGLWVSFEDLGVTAQDIRAIADDGQVLGDYKNNPKVASLEEMYLLMMSCQQRR